MIKINAELNDQRLTISSRANHASILEMYYVLAMIIKDLADKLDMSPRQMLHEVGLLVPIVELDERVELDKEEDEK